MSTVKVVVTGATGQVAYALLPRIAAGEMFPGQEVDLRLLDIPPMIEKAKGVVLELEDTGSPLLARLGATTDRAEAFDGVDWALLVGSVPRGPGMERGDLIRKNGPIFVDDGKALAAHAAAGVRVVVVGNPCNTNCLIARHAAGGKIPDAQWSAMTRLDQNRARWILAAKAGARVADVRKLAIWGNHSSTLFPDWTTALVKGRPAADVAPRAWLESDYIAEVQQRGAVVIAARGASSAFSAGQALIDHVRSLNTPTAKDDVFSAAVVSDGSYGVPKGLVSSFPLRSSGAGGYEIVQGLALNDFAKGKLAATVAELAKEKQIVEDLLA